MYVTPNTNNLLRKNVTKLGLRRMCRSLHECVICRSFGRIGDVNARDVAWRTPLEC
jgi:hypothetical protein